MSITRDILINALNSLGLDYVEESPGVFTITPDVEAMKRIKSMTEMSPKAVILTTLLQLTSTEAKGRKEKSDT